MFKIEKTKYKDISALKIITNKYEAVFLPEDGAKLVSFKAAGDNYEYLVQNPSKKYLRIRTGDSYVEGECSAFDDMFPTIDPIICKNGLRKGILYEDHGETCRSCFTYNLKHNELEMVYISSKLIYKYIKTVKTDDEDNIIINYTIHNLSDDDFEILWAAHCMLNATKGDKILLPYRKDDLAIIMFDTNSEYGKRGDDICFSENMIAAGDFNEKANAYKYYLSKKIFEGLIGLQIKNHKSFYIEYDSNQLPYLGIWINNGSFKNMQCIGLEPCTVAFDTVYNAEKYGQKCIIKPHDNFIFQLKINLR